MSYWVIIIALLVFYSAKIISETSQNYSLILAGTYLFFLYNYHRNRKDLNFLNKYFVRPRIDLCITYTILTLPISLAFVLSGRFLPALGLHLAVIAIIFITIKTSTPELIFIRKYIPAPQFEWIAGIRKNFYIVLILLLISLLFSPVKFFGPLALFLLTSIFAGFYQHFEPLVMLNPEGLSATDFLTRKTLFFTKAILIVTIPPLLINSIMHPDVIWFNICFPVGIILLGTFSIYNKYYDYKPNQELNFRIDSIFVFASVIIPLFIPVTIFLIRSYKKKALQNLSYYIDDKS